MGRRHEARARQGRPTPRLARGSLVELWQRPGDFESAVAVTRGESGLPRVHPVELEAPSPTDGCDPWFFASRGAARRAGTAGIEGGELLGLFCYGPEPGSWISIAAVARIEAERAAVHGLYRPDHRGLFPGGPDDPDLVVVRLDLLRAEQWDPIAGRLRVLYELLPSPASEAAAHGDATNPE